MKPKPDSVNPNYILYKDSAQCVQFPAISRSLSVHHSPEVRAAKRVFAANDVIKDDKRDAQINCKKIEF